MRAHLSKNYENDFPQQLLELAEGKISSLNTDCSKADIELDGRLDRIIHALEHLIDVIYPSLENSLQKDYRWLC